MQQELVIKILQIFFLLFIKEMHPDLSNEELEVMYDNCHGNGGMMGETNSTDVNNEINKF